MTLNATLLRAAALGVILMANTGFSSAEPEKPIIGEFILPESVMSLPDGTILILPRGADGRAPLKPVIIPPLPIDVTRQPNFAETFTADDCESIYQKNRNLCEKTSESLSPQYCLAEAARYKQMCLGNVMGAPPPGLTLLDTP
jgi:hypothetical protein